PVVSVPQSPPTVDEVPTEPPMVTQIQPLPGEVLSEERPPSATAAAPPSGGGGQEDYDRRGGRGGGRRDRDRRGKKPKIPSFEAKSYEPRTDDRQYSSSLEVLPGESLAKLARRSEGTHEEDHQNAGLG